jgi:hypothetical protein
MMACCDQDACEDWRPGAEISRDLFLSWREARRGQSHAQVMTNPVWTWLVRTQISAYRANDHFHGPSSLGGSPGWCSDRFGQSRTVLPDGRAILVAGEHEDYYDPDFYIYNDVIVRTPSDEIVIYGYPDCDFRPTDFHSSTLLPDGNLLLIGNLGYPDDRRPGTTQVYRLDPGSMKIAEVPTTGALPGWISRHRAELIGDRIVVRGGEVFGEFLEENIDDWELNVADWKWTRLTSRNWTRVEARRKDGRWNNLYRLWVFTLGDEGDAPLRQFLKQQRDETVAELGKSPDPQLVRNRYRPPVVVRYDESVLGVRMTIEGELPGPVIKLLTNDLVQKLSRLEDTPYEYRMY